MAEKTVKIKNKKTTMTKALTALALFSLVGVNSAFSVAAAPAPAGERVERIFSFFPITSVNSGSDHRSVNLEAVGNIAAVQDSELVFGTPSRSWPDLRVIELNFEYVQILAVSSPSGGGTVVVKAGSSFVRSFSRQSPPDLPQTAVLPDMPKAGLATKKTAVAVKTGSAEVRAHSDGALKYLSEPKVTPLLC